MSLPLPVLLSYHGEGEFRPPNSYWAKACDRQFVVGENVLMERREERSGASHRHYFASINEAWQSLPDDMLERFPNSEALRKYALIKAGYCDASTLVAASKAEAHRLAAFIRPMDEFAIVTVSGATVTRYTAKSQSMRAMGKADFSASKDAVLRVISELIGTDVGTLEQRGREAA